MPDLLDLLEKLQSHGGMLALLALLVWEQRSQRRDIERIFNALGWGAK